MSSIPSEGVTMREGLFMSLLADFQIESKNNEVEPVSHFVRTVLPECLVGISLLVGGLALIFFNSNPFLRMLGVLLMGFGGLPSYVAYCRIKDFSVTLTALNTKKLINNIIQHIEKKVSNGTSLSPKQREGLDGLSMILNARP